LPQYLKESKPNYLVSFVVPAYNEEKRLPPMLEKTLDYLAKQEYKWEIVVVSDAAKDKTVQTALSYAKYKGKEQDLKVIEYPVNKGKGGAVRIGMLASTGKYAHFLDADGATEIKDFDTIFSIMKDIERDGLGIVAGSRNHIFNSAEVVRERKWYRNILGLVSNFIVNVICGVKMKDTQCGFKLYHSNAARQIFSRQQLDGFGFDVEDLFIAKLLRIKVVETPVRWNNVEGTKVSLLNGVDSFLDPLRIRKLQMQGKYRE